MHAEQEVLKERLEQIEKRIQAACDRSNRKREEVKIIAVTKYVEADTIGNLLAVGVEDIGENRLQDALPKFEKYGDKGIWHFIGHLQTNKAKEVVGRFAYVHSLDRVSLAQELNKRGEMLNQVVSCFLQINISGEETKFGLSPDDVLAFLQETSNMKHIKIVGLMTMAPVVDNQEEARNVFRGLAEWKERINDRGFPHAEVTELSMGMSSDFEVAIEEGATYIRLGSVLVKPE
ncbi:MULTISPECIES: YggS family pyridoxal phosphate-dependent enzyme [Brevibacillus]|uniref:YggS family pyridoxal phosphate-dependent enzyme n=1 Tax=Brevibacillus TaxID=55080 RepID=UPI002041BF17|nr:MULTISPECIES: YggS family pyridoxal phosphate-dependent enzyme [Brevibacillus]MCM3078462.1 YggS family pyridoxal phosphate-dependent enzyme [Brevibacillus invocatus]MCM3428383.1 YggS family pyridoxal phosphate-dependent enzyme [Brevibacillus invocatus]MDH4616754.1 YggS family pyridoxal phosphate-dependent enzyme [Brevibacillus sp. AY1]